MNLKRLIIIIVVVILCIILLPMIIKHENNNKLNEAIENTKEVVKAAKKEYEKAYEYDGIGSLSFVDVDATKLDVKNKPESGTYTVVNRDNKILVTATNLKFDKYYCQYDGEKATCSKKAVKVENEELPSTGENYEEDDDVDSGEVVPDDDKDDLFNGQIKDDDVIIDEIPGGVQNFPKN